MFPFFNRYKDYTPLWSDASQPKTSRRNAFIASVILTTSVIVNIVLLIKIHKSPPAPLDNYQHLNSQPIVNEAAFGSLSRPNPHDNAVVTSLYTDAYATAIATLGHSLNRVNSTAGRILFYLPEKVSPRALCIATATGFVPHAVSRIPPPRNGKGVTARFMDQYSKLNLWTLDDMGVKSLVYLDADTLVLRNFDELFTLPFNFAAVPDVFLDRFALVFNAGVLYLRPSTEVYNDMLSKIATASYPMGDAEQSFLNYYYGAEAVRLPYAYNANLAIKYRSAELWESLKREARIVHYTLVKPFLAEADNSGKTVVEMRRIEENVQKKLGAFGGMFDQELMDWVDAWKDTRRTYAETFTDCSRHSATT
ncbi:hypothetical protein AcV5_002082 [Taiwanofungus camphoratus]|nr:hypothetical protein AcV5_002082 [Antrodia cinnamomea]